jgi:CBS domain-containing protein
MKVCDCMKRNVVAILATATIDEAVQLLVARHIGLLPVVDEKRRPVGVLGLRDLRAAELTRPTPETLARPVTTLMRPPTVIPEDCGLLRAYALMRQHDLHDLPVVAADGTLVGIMSRVDLATAVLAGWQAEGGAEPC